MGWSCRLQHGDWEGVGSRGIGHSHIIVTLYSIVAYILHYSLDLLNVTFPGLEIPRGESTSLVEFL